MAVENIENVENGGGSTRIKSLHLYISTRLKNENVGKGLAWRSGELGEM